MKAWGEEPQPEWVHIFFHTLDTISTNWYLEKKLQHGTMKWVVMKDVFLLTFSFGDEFECIDEVLQENKAMIFRTPI